MSRFRDPTTRADRATAIAAVAIVHVALGVLALSGSNRRLAHDGQPPTQLIDVVLPPPPPPPPPPPAPRQEKKRREAGASGKQAEPSPVVAPAPPVVLPAINPLPAAPVAGSGRAAASGAGAAGSGPGAGGAGAGSGGGGRGAGEGIGEDARLLSGGLDRRDYRYLRTYAAPSGRAVLAILIGPRGRVSQCSIRQSSGEPRLDEALCAILMPRMRWAPARDRDGRPITVGIYYTAVWSRD